MTVITVSIVCLAAEGPVVVTSSFGMRTKQEPVELARMVQAMASSVGFEVYP